MKSSLRSTCGKATTSSCPGWRKTKSFQPNLFTLLTILSADNKLLFEDENSVETISTEKDFDMSSSYNISINTFLSAVRMKKDTDQNIIEGKIRAETLDIKDINKNNSNPNKGIDRQPEEDKDNK